MTVECVDAGFLSYGKALSWQKSLAEKRRRGEIGDRLILLEHPPVYTTGRRDSSEDFLVSEQWLQENGMEVHKTDRGGRITYHGPGQLVGYLIFKLKESIPQLVWKIEESIIRLLAHFHLEGQRDSAHPGIWFGHRKVAAIGLHIARGVTTHGFSVNINCNLKPFSYIYPCGIKDREVTSLERELGWQPSMRDVKDTLVREMAAVFRADISVGGIFPSQPE